MPKRTANGKWILWDKAGQRHDRWPVDARGMLESGTLTDEEPSGSDVPDATPEELGLVESGRPVVLGLDAERKSRAGTLGDVDGLVAPNVAAKPAAKKPAAKKKAAKKKP